MAEDILIYNCVYKTHHLLRNFYIRKCCDINFSLPYKKKKTQKKTEKLNDKNVFLNDCPVRTHGKISFHPQRLQENETVRIYHFSMGQFKHSYEFYSQRM